MRKILFILLITFSTMAYSQVIEQRNQTNHGKLVIRLYNSTPFYMSCYYKDSYNYVTFTLGPRAYSMWYPVHGGYRWECR